MREANSFCRICGALCGTRLLISDDNRLVEIRGDKEHAHSRGYVCVKGVQAGDIYDDPKRLLHPLRRRPDGGFERIDAETAIGEIAATLAGLISNSGPESVALYRGTPNNMDAASFHMLPAFMRAIGSPSFFSTITIDQSAKAVAAERLGMWAGGRHEFQNSDVWMLVGINPMVSNWGGFGSIPPNPVLALKEAKLRGLKLIVIDPRRSETAHFADLFLQPRPGEDPTLAAGLLHIILAEGWHDSAFCTDHVDGLDRLTAAVAPFNPDRVARRTGVTADQLREAASLFARSGRRGTVVTGTGPDMAARSNLAEHLYECINVVCGRFLRTGEEAEYQRVLAGRSPLRAEAITPNRGFEKGHRSRIRGIGTLRGEMMSGILADEILVEGPGQIRALIVSAGNPAGAFPDQRKTVKALAALDLLVAIEPYMSETAQLAHYIFPPKLPYERPDLPLAFPMPYSMAFAQYTPAIVPPPLGAELIEDWRLLWSLTRHLGRPLIYDGVALDMTSAPDAEHLLAILARRSLVPLEEIKRHPGGKVYDLEAQIVQPARDEARGRFDVAPHDVLLDISEVAGEFEPPASTVRRFSHHLVSRRMREVMNTTFRHLPSTRRRYRFNPAYMHSDDLAANGLSSGDPVEIVSDHGRIRAVVKVDDGVRPGVISMTHGWGALPDDGVTYEEVGSSTALLVSTDRDVELINAMPRMSAIPVNIIALSAPD